MITRLVTRIISSLLCVSTFLLMSVGSGSAALSPFSEQSVVFTDNNGKTHRLDVEVAVTPEQLSRGLMGRTELADSSGMLFDFGVPNTIAMWMKDTPLSLDMIFMDADGRVVFVKRQTTPYSEAVIGAPVPVRYVLEVKAGGAQRLGIDTGSQMFILPR